MNSKKKVLVYPCGTEIGLEIYRAISKSTHFELIGGSSSYDHGRFVYEKHIDHLPFITDDSSESEIREFNKILSDYSIDLIYPAMDGVLYKFSEFRDCFNAIIVAPDFETAKITRSKAKTYSTLEKYINVPSCYNFEQSNLLFPLFMKPDVGQGSNGATLITNQEDIIHHIHKANGHKMLLMEYLPGDEYTVDCFTNNSGELIYVGGRGRKRIKGGISVNAIIENDSEFYRIANIINSHLKQRGGWFFQVKKNMYGEYVLLEVASRIAGASSFTRARGVNLPLLTLFTYLGKDINSVSANDYSLELDRALYNKYKLGIVYSHVYVDYDDTLVLDGLLNVELIAYLYQCINNNIKITLITKHAGDLVSDLSQRRINNLFDEIILLSKNDEKYKLISDKNSIFIDDSYGERKKIRDYCGIPVFDTNMIECLMD